MFYDFCKNLCALLSKLFFRLNVKGRENVLKVKGAIFAVNHASYFDPVFAGCLLPRPMCYLARETLFRNKICGWILRNVNAVPVDREGADMAAMKKVINLLKGDKLVLIFPEGTRSRDGNLQPAHAGISFMAIKAGVPVIPAYVRGSYYIFPKYRKMPRFGKAEVIIGEPIYFEQWQNKGKLGKEDYQEIADFVMEKIAALKDRN